MTITDFIGSAAACLTTVSFIPQVLKTIKSRDTSGISLWMYALFVTGIFAWMVYGYLKEDLPVLFANLITLLLSGTVLSIKVFAVRDTSSRR